VEIHAYQVEMVSFSAPPPINPPGSANCQVTP
jgi:hypothetical protein